MKVIWSPLAEARALEAVDVIYRVDPTRVGILTLRHSRRAWDVSEVSGV